MMCEIHVSFLVHLFTVVLETFDKALDHIRMGKWGASCFLWIILLLFIYLYNLPTSLLCELVECFRCLLMSVFQVCPVIIMVLRDYVSAKHMLTWLHLFCYICEWYLYIFYLFYIHLTGYMVVYLFVYVCVCERERESVCVCMCVCISSCVCVCVRER